MQQQRMRQLPPLKRASTQVPTPWIWRGEGRGVTGVLWVVVQKLGRIMGGKRSTRKRRMKMLLMMMMRRRGGRGGKVMQSIPSHPHPPVSHPAPTVSSLPPHLPLGKGHHHQQMAKMVVVVVVVLVPVAPSAPIAPITGSAPTRALPVSKA